MSIMETIPKSKSKSLCKNDTQYPFCANKCEFIETYEKVFYSNYVI